MSVVLLDGGADAAAKDASGDTPLHLVAGQRSYPLGSQGQADIVRLLLDRGGDAAVSDGNGETPCDVLDSEDDSVRALLCR